VESPTSGGKTQKETFDAEFKRIPHSRIKELITSYGKDESEFSAVDLCKEVLVGWRGVEDNGEELPFSEGARDRLLDVALVAGAIVKAFMGSLTGAKTKN